MYSSTLRFRSLPARRRYKIFSWRSWLVSKTENCHQGVNAFIENNMLYRLELIQIRMMYGKPKRIKADSEIREAVLFLSDALVDFCSSAAYRMRDDHLTPINAEV